MNIELILCIAGCTLVTVIPRILPLMYLSSESMPESVLRWLSYVPVAVMSALLFPDIIIKNNQLDISFDNIFLLAAFPSFMVAWKTKSFFGTIACAMASVAFLRYIGW